MPALTLKNFAGLADEKVCLGVGGGVRASPKALLPAPYHPDRKKNSKKMWGGETAGQKKAKRTGDKS